MLRNSVVTALVVCAMSAAPAFAQKIEVSPFAGAVVPLSNVIDEAGVELKHKAGIAFGGRVTAWMPGSLGFEGQAAYALSDVKLTIDGVEEECVGDECDSSIFFGAAKVLYRFAPPTGVAAFHIGGGPAVVIRGGNAYEGATGTTDIAGILNVGASFKVGPLVSVRVDAEDYLSSAKFGAEGETGETESKLQNDVVLSAGVQISVGR